ncbi:hypothetical protein M8J76_000510 [Diaphorina citri]|nr:hypothetical protein M8J75_012272 [Diaphorina citri]KAI5721894.1 hypothetical protein M8J76_000510 [Diaphorina citri]KAI5725027.1 hypothetical protein M8J77_010121 [Diaphorina citri]
MRPLYIEDKTTLSILRIKLFIIIIWCQVTRMFYVIEFEGDLLETIPTSWVIDGQCYYPVNGGVQGHIKRKTVPREPFFKIKDYEKHWGTFNTLLEARALAKTLSEEFSTSSAGSNEEPTQFFGREVLQKKRKIVFDSIETNSTQELNKLPRIRKPEATSQARARAFNRPNVTKFFNILTDVQKDRVYPPHRVFNVDETGLTTVQSKSSKVFALKGRRQVGSLTTAERGVLSTFVICMSAGGVFVPLMVIFPRQRMKPELADGAPPGTMFSVHKSGWMQTDLFTAWFEHFLSFVRPTREDPVLLILDGDSTHTKNVNFLERAKEMHTTVICLPPPLEP